MTRHLPDQRRASLTIGAGALAVIGACAVVVLSGCSTPGAPGEAVDPTLGNDKDYSITQTVVNQSTTQTLTLAEPPWVDNGGTLVQSESTIAPSTSQVYKAVNHGNGVQMKLTFTASNGATVIVDTDVPEYDYNGTQGTINGSGWQINNISVAMHNNPTASMSVGDCPGSYCRNTASFPDSVSGPSTTG